MWGLSFSSICVPVLFWVLHLEVSQGVLQDVPTQSEAQLRADELLGVLGVLLLQWLSWGLMRYCTPKSKETILHLKWSLQTTAGCTRCSLASTYAAGPINGVCITHSSLVRPGDTKTSGKIRAQCVAASDQQCV